MVFPVLSFPFTELFVSSSHHLSNASIKSTKNSLINSFKLHLGSLPYFWFLLRNSWLFLNLCSLISNKLFWETFLMLFLWLFFNLWNLWWLNPHWLELLIKLVGKMHEVLFTAQSCRNFNILHILMIMNFSIWLKFAINCTEISTKYFWIICNRLGLSRSDCLVISGSVWLPLERIYYHLISKIFGAGIVEQLTVIIVDLVGFCVEARVCFAQKSVLFVVRACIIAKALVVQLLLIIHPRIEDLMVIVTIHR